MEEPGEREKEKVKATIMQLSSLADLIGLRTYIIKRTPNGKSNVPGQWGHTRAYMQKYANPTNTDALIQLFESAGCTDELQAVRWLLKHDELVP